jgi:hypothetical protein
MRTKQDKVRDRLLNVYRMGIRFGALNCDKYTGLYSIENHVLGKINSFDKLAKKIIEEQ